MSLLHRRINSIEAEVQDVASQVSVLQTTISNGNQVANVIGDEGSGNLGFKLLDTSGNLRGITGASPYQVALGTQGNNKTLVLSGPAEIGSNGDNATNGFNLMLNKVIKSLKAGGYIQLTQEPGSITIQTNANLNTVLSGLQPALTVSGSDTLATGYKLINGTTVRDLNGANGITLAVSGNDLTITGPTGLAPTLDPTFSGIATFSNSTSEVLAIAPQTTDAATYISLYKILTRPSVPG